MISKIQNHFRQLFGRRGTAVGNLHDFKTGRYRTAPHLPDQPLIRAIIGETIYAFGRQNFLKHPIKHPIEISSKDGIISYEIKNGL